MAYLGAFLGLVALLQGVVWLGGRHSRRAQWGIGLAPAGALVMLVSLAVALAPGLLD